MNFKFVGMTIFTALTFLSSAELSATITHNENENNGTLYYHFPDISFPQEKFSLKIHNEYDEKFPIWTSLSGFPRLEINYHQKFSGILGKSDGGIWYPFEFNPRMPIEIVLRNEAENTSLNNWRVILYSVVDV